MTAPALLIGLVAAAGFATRLCYGFEWDELELLHAAWRVAHGSLPYRDFFEHHPPLGFFLLAPVVSDAQSLSMHLLIELRLAALAVLAATAWAFRALAGRLVPAAASLAPLGLVVAYPMAGKLFELRADWLALAALLTALVALVDAEQLAGRRRVVAWVGAGVLAGVAIACTQKALLLWLPVLLWSVLPGGSPGRDRLQRTAVLLAATSLPVALLGALFWWQGALLALVEGVIAVNVGWPRELDWRDTWIAGAPAIVGIVAIAVAALAELVVTQWRGDVVRPGERLVGWVAVAGGIAFLVTPVPWEQSALFLLVPWVVLLAFGAVQRACAGTAPGPILWVSAGAALLGCVAVLPRQVAARALLVWGIVALLTIVIVRRSGPVDAQVRSVLVVLLLPGMVQFAGDRLGDAVHGRGGSQLRFVRSVERRLGPRERILMLWDHVVPFRPAATFHWFAHEGVMRRFATSATEAATLDRELVAALAQPDVRMIVADPELVTAWLPRLAVQLRTRCALAVPGYAGQDAYVCERPDAR